MTIMERKMISQYNNGNIKNARRTRGFAHPRKSYSCLGAVETIRSHAGSSSVSLSDLADLEADNMFQEDIYKTKRDLVISRLGSKILMDEKSEKITKIISHYESFNSPICYKYTFCEVAFLMFKLCQAIGHTWLLLRKKEYSKTSKIVKF